MFDSTKTSLHDLLTQAARGHIKLPDFQRGWVWDDYAIRSLIASVSQSFPVGAIMMLRAGGELTFGTRQLEGTPKTAKDNETLLYLLDGQQRLTSLYQALVSDEVIATKNAQKQEIKRWYYIDMAAALAGGDREEAIIGVPEDRISRSAFGRDILRDLSSDAKEYAACMFPLNKVFNADQWMMGFFRHWGHAPDKSEFWFAFANTVLAAFKSYHMPVITLDATSSRGAICTVFEKVNSGGKKLDSFELLTAIYAGSGFNLRSDWLGGRDKDDTTGADVIKEGRQARLADFDVLSDLGNTNFLQAISLLHTRNRRLSDLQSGKSETDAASVSCQGRAILALPLDAYRTWADRVETGFKLAARFLRRRHIYWVKDVPYHTQLVPLASILALLGERWEQDAVQRKLAQWFWCGVFGEFYGSAVESRFAKDVIEVPAWIEGGPEPSAVRDFQCRIDRLESLRSRLSAAYKGVHALLMQQGARDFRSGQAFEEAIYFDDNVDIHHIFPKAWCQTKRIPKSLYDSIVNKTPISARTNRILGGSAPSAYCHRLETSEAVAREPLEKHLRSHGITPTFLRSDDFHRFFEDRRENLAMMIEHVTGKEVYRGVERDEEALDEAAE
ncbi:MAG: DUF262 domain-containing protein [Alphaproteobacteria bacterium]|nr:DUF262 domain-containing protein [Alphaproteobacteria bacterium]